MENKINEQNDIQIQILSQVNNPNARKHKFRDIRKIDMGLCRKDLITYRMKKKGAFYNCFAVILRILYNNIYKEVHVKIFNTGKLEIPGIQNDDLLSITLDRLLLILRPLVPDIDYNKDDIRTVLINSNFTCGFFIDRFKLFQLLKYKYNLHVSYDPCSYPGIQCKFCYHPNNKEHTGVYHKKMIDDTTEDIINNKKWKKISFMIFRTGSVLIVGNCDKNILNIIYNYLKKLLFAEYENICINNNIVEKKKSKKKIRKKTILFTST